MVITMLNILYPILAVGALALIFGGVLGFSSKKYAVETDPKVEKILNVLPGANCGGCGFPGCAVFAQSVADNEASYNGCPAAGTEAISEIAKLMGIDVTRENRKTAYVKCGGTNDNIKRNYIYDGPQSCVAASQLATGGNKSCEYSCIGLASCKHVCPFDAVKMVDNVAVINSAKCTACGKCVSACPKHLIEIVPEKNKVRVMCNSRDKGKLVRENCRAGCYGCKMCQKACKEGAISVIDNIAHIDYDKCTLCMDCVGKCPAKVIKRV